MNHAKRVLIVSTLLWAILLSACGNSSTVNSISTLNAIYTSAAQTVDAQAASSAQPTVDQSATVIPVDTDSPIPSPTNLPTLVSSLPTSTPYSSAASATGCNSSYVADATIPDGTVVSPGETFVKTWTLQNTGTCTWDTGFTMRFYSGDQMSGGSGTVSSSVAPGGQGDVSVTLTAPLTAGTYTGNWRLADDSSTTFGEIVDVVIDVTGNATATYELTDTPYVPTATPIIYTITPVTPATPTSVVPTSTAAAPTATKVPSTAAPTSTTVPTAVPTSTTAPTAVPTSTTAPTAAPTAT